tara:strand:- start:121 stop:249 length:129 start_codon:yes stop_codon:yes gene_type:complete
MKRRNFIKFLTFFLLFPKFLWAKKIKRNFTIKNGWLLKNEDL